MNKQVKSFVVTKVVFGTRIHIRRQGTRECTVRFMMTRAEEQRVRAHYKISADVPILFGSGMAQLFSTGGGWWTAIGDDWHVDGAIRAIDQIQFALYGRQHVQQGVSDVIEAVWYSRALKYAYTGRRVMRMRVVPVGRGSRKHVMVLNRRVQIAYEFLTGRAHQERAQTVNEALAEYAKFIPTVDYTSTDARPVAPALDPKKFCALVARFRV